MERHRFLAFLSSKDIFLLFIICALFLPAACASRQSRDRKSVEPPRVGQSSDPQQQGIQTSEPEDGQWLMPAKNYASTRFSGLDQINTGNAANLKVALTFSTGVNRGQEAAPIVVNNTMYVVTPYPNILYALDLTKQGSPVKWKYEPKPVASSQGVACCDLVNRGAVFSKGKIFYNTLDAQTVAVDSETGRELWRTKMGDINKGETITMAPLVVRDKVLVGNSGGEFGIGAGDHRQRLYRLRPLGASHVRNGPAATRV